jgi:hypothetical protein
MGTPETRNDKEDEEYKPQNATIGPEQEEDVSLIANGSTDELADLLAGNDDMPTHIYTEARVIARDGGESQDEDVEHDEPVDTDVENLPEELENEPIATGNNEATADIADLLDDNSDKQDQVQDEGNKMTKTDNPTNHITRSGRPVRMRKDLFDEYVLSQVGDHTWNDEVPTGPQKESR